jgi:hypothetical protein
VGQAVSPANRRHAGWQAEARPTSGLPFFLCISASLRQKDLLMSNALMIASSDEHFREMVRDYLLNLPNAKIVAEYPEVAANLYIRVLQELERNPGAGLIVDISNDPEGAIKAVEKVKRRRRTCS